MVHYEVVQSPNQPSQPIVMSYDLDYLHATHEHLKAKVLADENRKITRGDNEWNLLHSEEFMVALDDVLSHPKTQEAITRLPLQPSSVLFYIGNVAVDGIGSHDLLSYGSLLKFRDLLFEEVS